MAAPTGDVSGGGAAREQLRERVEQMVVWELSQAMKLASDKENKLFDIMRPYFRDKRDLIEKQFKSMKNLETLYNNEKTANKDLEKAVGDLEIIYQAQMNLENKLHQKLKSLLSVREQARFLIEWPRIQKEVRDKIHQFRQKRGGGGKGKGRGK